MVQARPCLRIPSCCKLCPDNMRSSVSTSKASRSPPPSSVRLTMKQRPKRWRCLTGRWLKSDGVEHASKSMEWKETRPHVRFCLSSRTWTRSWRPNTDIICVPSRNAYGKSKPESPGLRVYLALVSSTFPMEEHSLLKNVISHSGHVHLGYSPIEEYVLPSNREQASHLITRLANHSFQLLPGQGFYEDRFGALKPISQPHAFEGGNHNA